MCVISPANEYALSWTPSHQNKETFDICASNTSAIYDLDVKTACFTVALRLYKHDDVGT